MMEMLGLSVPNIVYNEGNASSKQEPGQVVFVLHFHKFQVQNGREVISSSKDENKNDLDIKSNSANDAKEVHQVGNV